MKVWITTYALTEGILEREVEHRESNPSVVVIVNTGSCYGSAFFGEGKNWHRTRESAIAKAEAMRVAKIKSLKKKLAELEALKFQ